MTLTTTAQSNDTLVLRTSSTVDGPTTSTTGATRLSRRTAWILGGAMTVAVVAGAAGVAFAVYEASLTPAPAAGAASGVQSGTSAVTGGPLSQRLDDVAHGAGSVVVTGTGATVRSGTARATTPGAPTDPRDPAVQALDDVAHGAGTVVVTGTGRPIH